MSIKEQLSQTLVDIASKATFQVKDMLVAGTAEAARGNLSIDHKSSFHDLVTKYDKEAEQILSNYIFQHYPDSTFMGEEGGATGQGKVHWYVDPIDGTSNFATGIPFFCVSIGAAVDGEIIAAVILDPIREELFSATTQGAFLNGDPITAKGNRTENEAFLLTAFPSPHASATDEDGKLMANIIRRFATLRRIGSAALSLAYVACGRVDAAYEPRINAWDVAAGLFILQQAGGCFVPCGQLPAGAVDKPWNYPELIATCPEFELEQSILYRFVEK